MTKQSVFDAVIDQLSKQGGPSIDISDNRCVYHNEGRMCPGGYFLKPELISADMAKRPFQYVYERLDEDKRKELNIPTELVSLINELQEAHDEVAREKDVNNVRNRFIEVADRHKLSVKAVSRIKIWNTIKVKHEQ